MKDPDEKGPGEEKGPRWGWTGGFLGATCWIPIMSCVLWVHGDPAGGIAGMLLCSAALFLSFLLRPWKHPDVELWGLYLGAVSPIFLSAGFLLWRYKIFVRPDESILVGLYAVVPLLLPALILGHRTWNDMSRQRR